VNAVQEIFQVSERKVCRALEQPRSTQRYVSRRPNDEDSLTLRVVELAGQYGRYGYRRITALLQQEGWRVNHDEGAVAMQARGTLVEARRLESTCETAQTRPIVVERRFLFASQTGVSESCLELRFCLGTNPGWQSFSHSECDR